MKISLRRRTIAIGLALALLISVGLLEALPFVEAAPQRSGPMSTYPASWTDVCELPVHGDIATNDEIPSQSASMGAPDLTLNQLYAKMINSSSFNAISAGRGWVTTYWGLQEISGPGYSYEVVVAQFVIVSAGLFGDHPSGYVSAYYSLQTGELEVDYGTALTASCPGDL